MEHGPWDSEHDLECSVTMIRTHAPQKDILFFFLRKGGWENNKIPPLRTDNLVVLV